MARGRAEGSHSSALWVVGNAELAASPAVIPHQEPQDLWLAPHRASQQLPGLPLLLLHDLTLHYRCTPQCHMPAQAPQNSGYASFCQLPRRYTHSIQQCEISLCACVNLIEPKQHVVMQSSSCGGMFNQQHGYRLRLGLAML